MFKCALAALRFAYGYAPLARNSESPYPMRFIPSTPLVTTGVPVVIPWKRFTGFVVTP